MRSTWLIAALGFTGLLTAGGVALASPTELHPDLGAMRWPDGVVRVAQALDERVLDVYLDISGERLAAFDEAELEALNHALWHALEVTGSADRVDAVRPWAVDPADPGAGWRPLVTFLPPVVPPAARPYEAGLSAAPGPPLVSLGQELPGAKSGFLSGKVVYVSQAHGFTWNDNLDRWYTQRGNTHGIVEDLVNAEGIDHYLVSYLRNAGATVFTVREHDLQTQMVIVDGGSGGASFTEGGGVYEEGGAWQDSTATGFEAGHAPYTGATNPHALGATRYATAVSGEPTAWARWTPDVPEDGPYTLYVSYAASPNRVQDAHFTVRHAGGETHLRVNQERHGGTWVELGTFWLGAGQDPNAGSVTLTNDTLGDPDGQVVSADAVRFGGGMGDIVRNGTGPGPADAPTSLRPRWEECSRYYAQFAGAPESVWNYSSADNNDDVGTRSRLAAWHNEPGEDAVYVAWHTNAPSPARGTVTYVYGPNPPDGTYQFTGVAGSDDLAAAVHDEIVADIRAAFDPAWKDRGVKSAYFGEVNPNHNPEMPATLVEVAFHDTAEDADWLEEPRFRQVVSRSFYQGIVKYFAARDGVAPQLVPEPPNRVRLTGGVAPGELTVAWDAPYVDGADLGGDAATSYIVYVSQDGRAFDDGTPVDGATELTLSGLAPGVPVFVKVAAVNAGGRSFPSPTIAAAPRCEGGPAPALLVHGFYRFDSALLPRDDLSPWGLGQVTRLRQREVNTYDYLVEHAHAFAAAQIAFDGAEATAIEDGALALDDYQLAVWQLGEESTVDETFSDAEQAAVAAWLGLGGGRTLVVSGAELGWDLGEKGSAADVAFLQTWLGVTYAADDAGTKTVSGAGAWASLGTLDFTGAYDVNYPDVLAAAGSAQTLLEYAGGAGAAALWFDAGEHRALTLGFPFEAIADPADRAALAEAVVALTGVTQEPPTCDGTVADGDADAGAEPIAEAGPDLAPDAAEDVAEVGPEPQPEAVEVVAEPGPDVATGDAGADAGGGPIVIVKPPSTATNEIAQGVADDGCAAGRGGSPAWWLVLLAVASIRARRRWPGPRAG